jgi:hypothetical protein
MNNIYNFQKYDIDKEDIINYYEKYKKLGGEINMKEYTKRFYYFLDYTWDIKVEEKQFILITRPNNINIRIFSFDEAMNLFCEDYCEGCIKEALYIYKSIDTICNNSGWYS